MVRDRTVFGMVLALGACSPDTSGAGSGLPPMPGDDGESEVDDDAGPTSGDEPTASAGASTSGATTTPLDDTGPAMDEGPLGHPSLAISNAPAFDFGPHNLPDSPEHAFTVTNEGDADATAVQVAGVGGAFSIVGHDCGAVLAPGAACEVQVRFDPAVFGDFATELQIAYQDQGMATMATRSIAGRGVGATGNLVVNGGGEEGNAFDVPPTGWQIVYGPSWSANWAEVPPVAGSRTISAGWGPPGTNEFALQQQIGVVPLTAWGDAGGVRFYFRAFHRAETDGNDPTAVVLRFRDSGGNELGSLASSTFAGITWNESVGNLVAPAGTHYVQLVLQCTRVYNDWCSGFFDGVEVWAEWLG